MKTNIETLANILSVAIWADGKYAADERQYISELATALGLDAPQFQKAVDASVANVKNADAKSVNALLKEAAKSVDDDEKDVVVEATADIVLADGVLEKAEVENVLAVAQALGVDLSEGAKAIISFLTLPEKWNDALQDEIDSAVKASPSEDALTASILFLAERVAKGGFIVNK